MLKYCKRCGENKPCEDFALNKTKSSGRQSFCRLCKKKYDSKYYTVNKKEQRARNKQYIEGNKARISAVKQISGGCRYCSEKTDVCLDFHHISDKLKNVSEMVGYSWERIKEEIMKCDLMCANCHRKHHNGIPLKAKHTIENHKKAMMENLEKVGCEKYNG